MMPFGLLANWRSSTKRQSPEAARWGTLCNNFERDREQKGLDVVAGHQVRPDPLLGPRAISLI